MVPLHDDFVPRMERRRREPTGDMLSDMVNAEVDGEGRLPTAELLPITDQELLAGHETTTSPIGNAMLELLRDPALMARLRAEPAPIEVFVEETLRHDPPIQCTCRRATVDTELRGVPVSLGAMVVPLWAAVGRDPAVIEQPVRVDPDRANVRRHMGFGQGPQFCAGAELARLAARIAFETLLARLADIELDVASSDLGHLPSFAVRGYRRVVLRFTRRE